jgi:hypothetical protein
MTFLVIPHMLIDAVFVPAAVWRAEDREGCVERGGERGGDGVDTMMEAVAMDNLDRTRSRGYVVPVVYEPR